MQAVLLRTLFPTKRAWGAPLPYTPSGDGMREGSHPLALSRGLVWRELGFLMAREAIPVEIWASMTQKAIPAGILFLMERVRLFW